MLDPLTGLALAGSVLQVIHSHRVVSSYATTIRTSDDLPTVHALRVGIVDANATVAWIARLFSRSTASNNLIHEQQTVRKLCLRCQDVGINAAEHLKIVNDALDRQQINPFINPNPDPDTHIKPLPRFEVEVEVEIDFVKIQTHVQQLKELAELLASIVTRSLAHTHGAHFQRSSLRNDVLQPGLRTILRLLEDGGANIKDEDFVEDGPVQQCIDVSTQSRLDSLNNIDAEPLSLPLRRTRLRRKTILDLLYFRQMSDRIEEVNIAYKRTLEWIFRDKEYNLSWSSFPDFLKSESSDLPYWINGKAGSGKSTLLRFLVKHEKTLKHLRTWSAGKDLKIGHFFSWNLGSTLQKTQTGLLQSLVYQILEKDQTLIHQAFPDLWDDIDVARPTHLASMPFKSLKLAFIKLINISASHRYFCFFVDGIDEFDEDHVHVADLILGLAAPNLKFVVSSRPVDACLDRFDRCPKLRLQDLTADDIQTYIDGRLSSHANMLEVMQDEPKAAAELVRELKERASGVFLWVKLVVTSLLDGLRKGDDVTELKIRLRQLPPDLSKLYASMLGKMDPNYSKQAAILFRLVRTASVLLDGQSMPTQYLAVAGNQFRSVVNGRPVAFETAKVVRWCRVLMRQLYSRCCGLVELASSIYTPDWWHADLDNVSREDRKLLAGHIQFLHRTVTEYLYQDDIWSTVVSMSSELETFNPHENLAYAALHMMKISPLADQLSHMQAYCWAQTLVRATREFERETEEPLEDLVDELNLVLSHQISTDSHWTCQIEFEPAQKIAISHLSVLQSSIRDVFSFAAFVGLSQYVETKLAKHRFVLDEDAINQQILIQSLFSRSKGWTGIELTDKLAVVASLLEHGANPNTTIRGPSFWQCCLQHVGAFNCQSSSSARASTRHRRASHRTRFDSRSGQDNTQCTCSPQEVHTWSQLLLCCLTAGARRADIDYLAPFSQNGQEPQICRFSQLCQTLYQVKSGNGPNAINLSDDSNKWDLEIPVKAPQKYGANYGTNVISGPATAHLGDEYIYGNRITHVHHNYFGAGNNGLLSQRTPSASQIRQTGVPDESRSSDAADTLAWFRQEVSEALKDSSESRSKSNATDIRREKTVNTTHGETPSWKRESPDRDTTMLEEIFEESFNKLSLVTTTNDSDHSDDEGADLPPDHTRRPTADGEPNHSDHSGDEDDGTFPWAYTQDDTNRTDSKFPSFRTEHEDVFVTPRSASVNVSRRAPSAHNLSYELTSGSAHYLKNFRGRG